MKNINMELNHRLKDINPIRLITAALLSAAVVTVLMYSGLLKSANMYLSDLMYQREAVLEGNIFVIGIDERALENIGPFHTWKRSVMADVIDALNVSQDCKPAVIGVDIMYFGQSDEESDARLAEAAARYGNVVSASRVGFESMLVEQNGELVWDKNAVSLYELPYDMLRDVTEFGHINTMTDSDGVIHHAIQYIDLPEAIQKATGIKRSESFAYRIYQQYARINGLEENPNMPLGAFNEWYIPYSAKPGGYSDNFSVWDILSGELPPEIFADSIVLIGPYANGLLDNYVSPIDRAGLTYGVEIHANVINAMLNGVYRQSVPDMVSAPILFVLLLGLFMAFYFLSPVLAAVIMLAVSGLYVLLAWQMVFPVIPNWFIYNVNGASVRFMLPPLYFPLAIVLLYIGILVVNFINTQKQKKQVTETFKKYVDPAIIEDIFEKGLDDLQLGGRLADICVMFVDIRGFTPMSEVMKPQEVVAMLGEYLELTSSAIFKHKGTLDKFIGDATMAFFNAPLPLDDYVYKAVLTAWDIVQSGLAMEKKLQERYGRTVSFGIGLHCGEAVVGNIGTQKRVDYTAIGNTVNTSARLESNARPAQVLMSEAVYKAVSDRITARCVGNIPLKGKSEELTVYALEHINEYTDQQPLASALLKPGK